MSGVRSYYASDETDEILNRRFPNSKTQFGKGDKSKWIREAILEKDQKDKE